MQVSPSQDYMMKPEVISKIKQVKSPDKSLPQEKGKTITWLRDKLKSTLENAQKEHRIIPKSQSKGKYELKHSSEHIDQSLCGWKFVKLSVPFTETLANDKALAKGDSPLQYALYMFQDRSTRLNSDQSLKQISVEIVSGLILGFLTEPGIIGFDNTVTLIKRILDIGGLYSGFDIRRKSAPSVKQIFLDKCLGKKIFEQSATNFIETLLFSKGSNRNFSILNFEQRHSSEENSGNLIPETSIIDNLQAGTGSADMKNMLYSRKLANMYEIPEPAQSPRKGLRTLQSQLQGRTGDQSKVLLKYLKQLLDTMSLPVSLWKIMVVDKSKGLSSQEKVFECSNQLLFSSSLQILFSIDTNNNVYLKFGVPQLREKQVQTAKAVVNRYLATSKKYQGSVERKSAQDISSKFYKIEHKKGADNLSGFSQVGLLHEELKFKAKTGYGMINKDRKQQRSTSVKNNSARGEETAGLGVDKSLCTETKRKTFVEQLEKVSKQAVGKDTEKGGSSKEQNQRKQFKDLYLQLLGNKGPKNTSLIEKPIVDSIVKEPEPPLSSRDPNPKKHYLLEAGNGIDKKDAKIVEEVLSTDKNKNSKQIGAFLEKYKKKRQQNPRHSSKIQSTIENRHSFDCQRFAPEQKRLLEKVNLTLDPFEGDYSLGSIPNNLKVESLRVSPKPFYDKLSYTDAGPRDYPNELLISYCKESKKSLPSNDQPCNLPETVILSNHDHQTLSFAKKIDPDLSVSPPIAAINVDAKQEGKIVSLLKNPMQIWAAKQKMILGIGGFEQLLAEHTSSIRHSLIEHAHPLESLQKTSHETFRNNQIDSENPGNVKLYLHRTTSSASKSQTDLYKPLSSKRSSKNLIESIRDIQYSAQSKDLSKNFSSFNFTTCSRGQNINLNWGQYGMTQDQSSKYLLETTKLSPRAPSDISGNCKSVTIGQRLALEEQDLTE